MIQDTSISALHEEKRNHSNQKIFITNLLSVYGTLTNKEISRIAKLETSSVSGRVNDLRKEGLVSFCEKRICSISGKRVNAWRLIQ
jgi:Mn-dependent DtxR family transcriptional regulator